MLVQFTILKSGMWCGRIVLSRERKVKKMMMVWKYEINGSNQDCYKVVTFSNKKQAEKFCNYMNEKQKTFFYYL